MPENTIGLTSLYPCSISPAGFSAIVIVSPMRISDASFMFATTYPVHPVSIESETFIVGAKWPTSLIVVFRFLPIISISSPGFRLPENTLTKHITPLNESKRQSKIRARVAG
ncbi:unknown [Coraliomargarita sp. CAG:312]|nr:unknown [Coraliomargarita sp. CAG:312]